MSVTTLPDTKYTRTPYLIVTTEPVERKDVYGSIDDHVVRQAQLLRGSEPSDTVIVAMHPIGSPAYLPAFPQLARRGFHVIGCGTRYTNGDASLQMENALLDLAACVRDARERLGYKKVILAGWSGGGSLMAGYQAEAEHKQITQTAAGEYSPLADSELLPADGLLMMAAHRSRHVLVTEFLDPSILDEDRPDDRDAALNIYDPGNQDKPPFTPEYVARYRAAQIERNRRITRRAQERLAALREQGRPDDEYCFVVQGTMADLRWVDPAVDPNDRQPNWSYLGDPRIVNDGPAGLARFTTLRGWLSQWGYDTAQVDAVSAAPRISIPVLTIMNSADDACPASHLQDFHAALPDGNKEMHVIDGANHYFSGGGQQRAHLDTAAGYVRDWAGRSGFAAL